MPKPKEFRVREAEALRTSLMEYLQGDECKWLREHWIPELLDIAGTELPAGSIAVWIRGTVSLLVKDGSRMDPKPEVIDKIYITQELFRLFFDSKEVADEAWEQIPECTARLLETAKDYTSRQLEPMLCKVLFTSEDSNKAGRREEEFKHEARSTVIGFSSCGPPGFSDSSSGLRPLSPSPDGTSSGDADQSEGSSTFSRSKHEGPNKVDDFPSHGNLRYGLFPDSSGSFPNPFNRPPSVYGLPPSFTQLPSSFAQPPSSTSPDGTSSGVADQSEDEGSSTFSRSKHEGPNKVYNFSSGGPPGFGLFPYSSSSLHCPFKPPSVYGLPSASGLPSPFAQLSSSISPGVTSYAVTEQSENEGSSTSNRSKHPWDNFGVRMNVKLVDDDGVVFESFSFENHYAAKENECDGEEET
ncbi:hypothetical protein MGU_08433 [Metarhizium guizhouense ARSEF 977]|uniref:Uncharacterized protein n=1 Tax=Metarhizium guizhouense (strain ARSEF 977) TaxID=1276136 RepID=A0A0B4GXA7_METGA|nr:hypothetical protein MGU_08433 [Metarhizium guizhouense ARSEF 977]